MRGGRRPRSRCAARPKPDRDLRPSLRPSQPIRDDYTAKWRSWRPCARATGIGVSSDADLEFPLQQLGQGRESAADTFAVEHCMGLGQGKYQLVLFVGERDLVDDAGAADRKHVTRPN